jgi:Zn-finger nucleic acid-binding protein
MSEKKGIEIDYCPNCRGIWLDRGELEKLMERSGEHYSKRANYESDSQRFGYDRDDRNDHEDRDDYKDRGDYKDRDDYRQPPYKKKKSFLDDLFDF